MKRRSQRWHKSEASEQAACGLLFFCLAFHVLLCFMHMCSLKKFVFSIFFKEKVNFKDNKNIKLELYVLFFLDLILI